MGSIGAGIVRQHDRCGDANPLQSASYVAGEIEEKSPRPPAGGKKRRTLRLVGDEDLPEVSGYLVGIAADARANGGSDRRPPASTSRT